MRSLVDQLTKLSPLGRPLATFVVIVGLFLLAWVVSRVATRLTAYLVDRSERRRLGSAGVDTGVIVGLRQRETAISLVGTTVRYLAFAVALVLSVAALSGARHVQTVVGASFLALVIVFSAQRFLTDVIAGLLMFFEGWFRIGDTIVIDPWHIQGVVEAASLRSLTLRSISGETVHVPNSQVVALHVVPRGYREIEVEFFATALEPGRELVDQVARIVPGGPTRFVHRPAVIGSETIDDDLYRIVVGCAVAAGREWLADDFLLTVIKEQAPEGLLVHGPIVAYVDERAVRAFTRAAVPSGSRRNDGRGGSPARAEPPPWPG